MNAINKWAERLRFGGGEGEDRLCLELAKASVSFLEDLKRKGLSKTTIQRHDLVLYLLGHEIIRDVNTCNEQNKTLNDFIGMSYMPAYFCIDRNVYKFDNKALLSYEKKVEKFWDYYSEVYLKKRA